MNRLWACSVFAIVLAAGTQPLEAQNNPAVTVNVDANANQRAINPLIYGLNFGDVTTLNALNATANRYGGNRTSRYNWSINADGTASDWYYESYPAANVPGGITDSLIDDSFTGGAEPMITVPMLDYVAKLGAGRTVLCSFSIAKYGAQSDNDWEWYPDCGNGVKPDSTYIVGNDPLDAGVASSPAVQQAFIQHNVDTWGAANAGGVKYYVLDNEHGIWHETHRDVHPDGADMDELWTRMRDYSVMIKGVDANAKILAPEEFGWTGYFYAGADLQDCNAGLANCWSDPPDWLAHCGGANEPPCDPIDYMGWLLDQFQQYETDNGTRLLDVFTLHYYPQGDAGQGIFEYSDDVSAATQDLRSKSTRSLWDPTYQDVSWIGNAGPDGGIVRLIPRMKQWVADRYPNTLTGITEYHWGAENHINGATTQADILGIFGREGLDMATLYTDGPLNPASPMASAFKMYRNYDGNSSTFGDTSVQAAMPGGNPDNVSAFAATRASDGALTILVISKYRSNNTPVTINVSNFSHNGTAKVWRLNNNNTISQLTDETLAANAITDSLPRQTVTLYVVQPAVAAPDFSVSCAPSNLFAAPGAGDTSTCTVTAVGGFNSDVTLSCSGLPAGITCGFGTNPVAPTGDSALTVSVDGGVAEDTYNFTVEGTDGVDTRTQNMSIVVSTGPAALLFDDFSNETQEWDVQKGNWVESGGALISAGDTAMISAPTPWNPSGLSGCTQCTLETTIETADASGNLIIVQPWFQDKSNRVDVVIKEDFDKIILKHKVNGTVVAKGKALVPIDPGTPYLIKVTYDGAGFALEVDGNPMTYVFDAVAPFGNLWFKIKNSAATIYDVIIY